jgi:hypothetical protein
VRHPGGDRGAAACWEYRALISSWDDVRRIALSLPESSEKPLRDRLSWRVRDKLFAWERPLGPSDLRDLAKLGRDPPEGEILGVRVEHEGAKLALIESEPGIFFTIPHFDGYSAILIRLEKIGLDELEELIVESWLLRAPKRLAAAYLAAREQ